MKSIASKYGQGVCPNWVRLESLFKAADPQGNLFLTGQDYSYFSPVIGPANTDGRVICQKTEGGFNLRLKSTNIQALAKIA